MAILSFPAPSVSPSFSGSSADTAVKVYENNFGDGYTQRGRDSLNSIRDTLSLSWDNITTAEKDAIISFFELCGGTTAFYYDPWGDRQNVPWTCKSWKRAPVAGGLWKVSASLRQEYDV